MPTYQVDNHNLFNEFPQHADRIERLWQNDDVFAVSAERYHTLDRQIRGLEMTGIPVADAYFDALRKERVYLKDRLHDMLEHPERQSLFR